MMQRDEGWYKALKYIKYILLCVMSITSGVLFFAALYLSLNTPFALIDDYGDWLVAKYWADNGEFLKWLNHVFLSDSLVRYFPFFELYNYATWTFLGPSSPFHHLARWGVKMTCLLFSILTVSKYYRLGKTQVDSASHQMRYALFWPSLLLATIFLFFPNQPDARLAPQELNLVFFLTFLNYSICRLLQKENETVRLSLWIYILFVFSYIGLSFTKEISIAVLAWVIIFLMVTARKYNLRSRFIILSTTIPIFLFTLWRIYIASSNATYGKKSITTELVLNNSKWLYKELFQFSTSVVLGVILLFLFFLPFIKSFFKNKHAINTSSQTWFIFFIFGEFATLYFILSLSWMQVLRYWYPLIPLLAILAAISVITMQEYGKKMSQLVLQIAVLATCIFFTFTNGYNYLLQYMSQYANRNVDDKVLSCAITSIENENIVYIILNNSDPDMELNVKFKIFFQDYLPFYHNAHLDLNIKTDFSKVGSDGILFSTRKNINNFHATRFFTADYNNIFLNAMYHVSALTQFRKKPRFRLDAGVHSESYSWYVYSKDMVKL